MLRLYYIGNKQNNVIMNICDPLYLSGLLQILGLIPGETLRESMYENWAHGEPSTILGMSFENCCCMRRRDNWKWHDYHCHADLLVYNFICQYRKYQNCFFWSRNFLIFCPLIKLAAQYFPWPPKLCISKPKFSF